MRGIDLMFQRISALPGLGPLLAHRFVKFGTVGFVGTLVNLTVLFLGQEALFRWIQPQAGRLKASLAFAILISTLHNYLWNRSWTWRERSRRDWAGFFFQMGQYFLACGLAIGLQYLLTLVLALFIHYLAANVTAILLSAVITYLLNDLWIFTKGRIRRTP